MIKIDLVTGFLGSGKTTFLKKYAAYHISQGHKIGILENDYGAVNVDMLLLGDLRGDLCELEMVAGGCDADCHKRRFKTKLIAMAMSGYERVIVEPSGIFDVDEFFDVLCEEPLDRFYEIGTVFAVMDARTSSDLSPEAKMLLASQVANAGVVLLSKSQYANASDIERTLQVLQEGANKINLRRDITSVIEKKSWDLLEEADFERFSNAGYELSPYVKRLSGDDHAFSTIYFLEIPMTAEHLKGICEKLFAPCAKAMFGTIFRVKGFFREDGNWYEWNATAAEESVRQIPVGQEVLIVIGESLKEQPIRELFQAP